MSTITEKDYQHIPETSGCKNHDRERVHELLHELSRHLDGDWRYDQYIANAEGHEDLRRFWNQVKSQEQETIEQFIEKLISQHIESNCF